MTNYKFDHNTLLKEIGLPISDDYPKNYLFEKQLPDNAKVFIVNIDLGQNRIIEIEINSNDHIPLIARKICKNYNLNEEAVGYLIEYIEKAKINASENFQNLSANILPSSFLKINFLLKG